MSKVALVIPARLGSTRLARKALADIEGQPMVVRVAERAAKARNVSRILVATDSEEIVNLVKKAGFEARMTPESLNSGTERVAYVAKELSEEVIVNLQGDEPVMHPLCIEAALEPVLKRNCRMGSAYTPFKSWREVQSPACVKVIVDKEGDAIFFSRYAIPYRQNPLSDDEIVKDPHFGKHLGIYVYRRDFLLTYPSLEVPMIERSESLEQLRALHHGVKIGMGRTNYGSQSVDTAEDLELARSIFREQKGKI
ncbi:MAG TPA: 3-deoxy-manno-octulosonate cytidylyltransferase [Bdellovibrionota bacterium]|jgi:3-deoxy-manno-octulosonate cytidylyltransferase (CMP-KDO synthetase)